MKILSEKTGQTYETVEACLAAEEEYDAAIAAENARKEQLVNERKADAEKVEAKRQALLEAQKEYREELTAFCSKYGAYHYTIKQGEGLHDLFSSVFDSFWL